ncbi:fasciclin domain-containing protein [Flagellimonas sp. HMM57]|uniref:fasciclin domain-containing protein n=1 Tax=unclassified Flagellimonas TaxID=2644544 RepID=UPI0013D583AE|nr:MULTISPECIES: fasciclin domain-containing protein [unclassified Flagellimonas]UII76372.1 fasciclin domain-containing protein [Flagellimonas sp. HMM57]
MKNYLRLKNYLFLVVLTVFVFSSCDKEDDGATDKETEAQSTIVQTAQNTDALTSLVAALTKADENEDSDLVGTLNGEGTFTVFAPTNEAFTELFQELDDFDSLADFDTPEKRSILATILQYHVVSGVAATAESLDNEQKIPTVQGEDVTIRLDDDTVFVQDATDADAEVIIEDVTTSNGIVHVIDKVLLPQTIIDALNEEEVTSTLVDIVVATDALSLLEEAVIKAGLVNTLNGEGPFTVFAPTDDAFVALLGILGDDYSSLEDFDTEEEIALLRNILLYHVIPAKVLEADLQPGDVPTAFDGNSISVIASNDTFVIGDASDVNANITGTDIMASNGVAHTIDKVLLPQAALDFVASLQLKTIVEIAVETDDLGLLVEALQTANAGLVETLSGDGPFTVFAPTNQAFKDLLDFLGDDFKSLADFDTQEEKDLLVTVLTYHVVAGNAAFSDTLNNGDQIETFQGENVGINIKDGTIHIEDATEDNATVVLEDVEASNGVVHVINKVLVPQAALDILFPPKPNIVELAQSVDDLSLLVAALIQADAGLVDALGGDGPFTVFAPTNKAFKELLNGLGNNYNSLEDFDTPEEKALLAQLLLYHVVAGEAIPSSAITGHVELTTEQGEKIEAVAGHPIKIRDKTHTPAKVVAADNEASNGIVHIIDKVLLPQEIIDALH